MSLSRKFEKCARMNIINSLHHCQVTFLAFLTFKVLYTATGFESHWEGFLLNLQGRARTKLLEGGRDREAARLLLLLLLLLLGLWMLLLLQLMLLLLELDGFEAWAGASKRISWVGLIG